jgi:Protein of unknown function (DUF1656)
MIGEISVDGVYVPALLVFVFTAVILAGLLSRLLSLIGFYRLVAYRPVTDIALFFLVLAVIVWFTERYGLRT